MKVRDGRSILILISALLGPLELTRRTKALVWDDEIEITADEDVQDAANGPMSASQASILSVPLPRKRRSLSAADHFPPPIRRVSTEAPRPVPFSHKFQRVHPGTTGVTVLEHLERLDAVEASLKRLGVEDSLLEHEEIDVGEALSTEAPLLLNDGMGPGETSQKETSLQFSPVTSHEALPSVPEVEPSGMSNDELDEEDLVAMSKSTSHMEVSPRYSHGRWASQTHSRPVIDTERGGFDWMQQEEGDVPKRTVIVEVIISYLASIGF